jgi:hypothetical protein
MQITNYPTQWFGTDEWQELSVARRYRMQSPLLPYQASGQARGQAVSERRRNMKATQMRARKRSRDVYDRRRLAKFTGSSAVAYDVYKPKILTQFKVASHTNNSEFNPG